MLKLIGLVFIVALSINACTSASVQKRETARLHLQLGISYLEKGSYPMALQEMQTADRLDPNNPVIQNNLGLVYFGREKYDLAEQKIRRAVELNPQFSDARNNLSRVLIQLKRYSEAEIEAKKVIEDLTYTNPEKAHINLGLIFFEQKKYELAQKSFSDSLRIEKNNCVASAFLGRSYFEMNQFEKACESLDRAITVCQQLMFDEPHYYSGLCYFRNGQKAKAAARLKEVMTLYPEGKYKNEAKSMLELIR